MALLDVLMAKPPPLRVDEDGTIRVGATRVTLDTVITAFSNGASAEEIVMKYPTLDLTDVYAVITYYRWHPDEVEAYLEQRRQQAAEIRQKMEALFPPQGVRERLLARRANKA